MKLYRGYNIKWKATGKDGHWIICDKRMRFVGSADREELDKRIDELEEED